MRTKSMACMNVASWIRIRINVKKSFAADIEAIYIMVKRLDAWCAVTVLLEISGATLRHHSGFPQKQTMRQPLTMPTMRAMTEVML